MHKVFCPLLRPDGAASHTMLGILISGIHAGPTLLVPLPRAHVDAVAGAMEKLPRIGDIFGQIALVNIGAIGAETAQDAWLQSQIGPVDETLYLSAREHSGMEPQAVGELVSSILDMARTLGMISGCGIAAFRSKQQSVSANTTK